MRKRYSCYLLALVFLSIFSYAACRKNSTQADNPFGLPNATTIGANTLGCMVKGKPFVALNEFTHLGASFQNDTLLIGGQPDDKNYFQTILIKIRSNPPTTSMYKVDDLQASASMLTDSTCAGIVFTIREFKAVDGSVRVTKYDIGQKIIAGTFSFLIPVLGCDSLKITDGRFDIRYH